MTDSARETDKNLGQMGWTSVHDGQTRTNLPITLDSHNVIGSTRFPAISLSIPSVKVQRRSAANAHRVVWFKSWLKVLVCFMLQELTTLEADPM